MKEAFAHAAGLRHDVSGTLVAPHPAALLLPGSSLRHPWAEPVLSERSETKGSSSRAPEASCRRPVA